MNDDLPIDDPLVPADDPLDDEDGAAADPLKTPHLDPDEESLEDLAEAEDEEEMDIEGDDDNY